MVNEHEQVTVPSDEAAETGDLTLTMLGQLHQMHVRGSLNDAEFGASVATLLRAIEDRERKRR